MDQQLMKTNQSSTWCKACAHKKKEGRKETEKRLLLSLSPTAQSRNASFFLFCQPADGWLRIVLLAKGKERRKEGRKKRLGHSITHVPFRNCRKEERQAPCLASPSRVSNHPTMKAKGVRDCLLHCTLNHRESSRHPLQQRFYPLRHHPPHHYQRLQ